MKGFCGVALGALLCWACGGAPAAPATGPDGLVQIECAVSDAELWLDGSYLAEVREAVGGLSLPPGRHRLIVRHDQHHEAYVAFDVAPGEKKRLSIELARRFPRQVE